MPSFLAVKAATQTDVAAGSGTNELAQDLLQSFGFPVPIKVRGLAAAKRVIRDPKKELLKELVNAEGNRCKGR